MDYTALASEIHNDPAGLGYAPYVESGDDASIVNLLNAKTTTVQHDIMPKDQFLFAILPAMLALSQLDDNTQKKWDRILMVAAAASAIAVTSPEIQYVLGLAVQDGLLTLQQAEAVGIMAGSRAESLLGANTFVTVNDISMALRGL